MNRSRRWTRDELLVALNFYHKIPFGQISGRHPAIIDLARRLGRTSNSLSMKLGNMASFDPVLKLRGIRGLTGASALDREMWDEFHANLADAVAQSEEAMRKLFAADETSALEVLPKEGIRVHKRPPSGSTESAASTKVRRGQEFFREVVINNFGGRCGVTRLAVRELLIASHILPWSTHVSERLNVRNGLCLSRLHDAAFDQGMLAFDDQLHLMLSLRLKAHLSTRVVEENFGRYEGQPLNLPDDAVLPDPAFLAQHRTLVFD